MHGNYCTRHGNLLLCADQLETSTSPPGKPRAFELLKIGLFKFRPFGPKWCSNAPRYRRISLSNALPKEQALSAPVMSYYKNHNFNIETNNWKLNLLSRTMSISQCKLFSNSETRQRFFNGKYMITYLK